MKTTVEIPDELFRKAKTLAATRGISFKDILVHSLESELDNIIDLGISNKDLGIPKRREKKPLEIDFANPKRGSFPKAEFIKIWNYDPIDILLADRRKQDEDFLP